MKKSVDLNSDIGEGFGTWRIGDGVDAEIMPLITSANIATGFHAGDPNIMNDMVQLAVKHGVSIGAHPSFHDLVGFGRRHIKAQVNELVNDLIYQIGALREFTRLSDVSLRHVKPHGALYMHVAQDESMSRALVAAIQRTDPSLYLYCMAHSHTYRVASEMGLNTVREFYADRDYDRNGSIVFVRQVKPLDPKEVAEKVLLACQEGIVRTIENEAIPIEFDSVCIHSDTPGALSLVKNTRNALLSHGVAVKAHSIAVG
jgi:UPF0271 protein